eukprot:2126698-Rhodomonas_salina.5
MIPDCITISATSHSLNRDPQEECLTTSSRAGPTAGPEPQESKTAMGTRTRVQSAASSLTLTSCCYYYYWLTCGNQTRSPHYPPTH